jgi:hypothetical protein
MAFAENPLILNQVFGPKLSEVGLEASYLVPLPWYSDFLVGLLNGNNEYLFDSDKQEHLTYLVHFDNLWDLSDETTWRLGASYVTGAKGLQHAAEVPFDSTIENINSQIWGVDFQLKWKPLQYSRYRSFVLEGEYVNATLNIDGKTTNPLHGFFVQGLYQFGLRWWVQGRYGWFNRSKELFNYFQNPSEINLNKSEDFSGYRASIALAYVPTEFGAYRLQYNWIDMAGYTEQQILAQVNITMGSHPAHKY